MANGRPTNPRCYPAAPSQDADRGSNGTFSGARRAADLGRTSPDATDAAIQGINRAQAAGTISEARAGALIAGLMAPPTAAAQAALRVEPLTPEQRAAARAARHPGPRLPGELTLADVINGCRKPKTPHMCKTAWPGGWIPVQTWIDLGRPPNWIPDDTPGVLKPGCWPDVRPRPQTWGEWVRQRGREVRALDITQPPGRLFAPFRPGPDAPPPAPPAAPAGEWMCKTGWPGGWITVAEWRTHPFPHLWAGPVPYGVRAPGCFGGV